MPGTQLPNTAAMHRCGRGTTAGMPSEGRWRQRQLPVEGQRHSSQAKDLACLAKKAQDYGFCAAGLVYLRKTGALALSRSCRRQEMVSGWERNPQARDTGNLSELPSSSTILQNHTETSPPRKKRLR